MRKKELQSKSYNIFKKESEMEKVLKELVSNFKQEGVVRQLLKSDDKIKTFKSIQKRYKKQLNFLREEAVNKKHRIDNELSTKKNAVIIATICLMAEIEDYELFKNYEQLYYSLQQIEGTEEYTAMKMYKHFVFGKIMTKKSLQKLILEFY